TDRIVSSGSSVTSCFARSPTTTSPPGRNATADGRRCSPVSGLGSTRGPPSSSTATRLFVVPRSMPTVRSTRGSPCLFDVTQQAARVVDLRQAVLEVVEREVARVRPRQGGKPLLQPG